MPVNKNALLRFRVIETQLKSVKIELQHAHEQQKLVSVKDLQIACTQKLVEEGLISDERLISERTIKNDLKVMQEEFKAPIAYMRNANGKKAGEKGVKGTYYYEDNNFSIFKSAMHPNQLGDLRLLLQQLRQFDGFAHLESLASMVRKMEKDLADSQQEEDPHAVIEFEQVNYQGARHLNELQQAIRGKQMVWLLYKAFDKEQEEIRLHPYLLKEFNNRYYVYGFVEEYDAVRNYALDRILDVDILSEPSLHNGKERLKQLRHVIGVTLPSEQPAPQQVRFWASKRSVGYLDTRPLHHSQNKEQEDDQGAVYRLYVYHNTELEMALLRQGENIRVLEPESLREKMRERVEQMMGHYSEAPAISE